MDVLELEALDSGSESGEGGAGGRGMYARTNQRQFQIMLDFMEQHEELRKGAAISLSCLEKWEVLRQALDAAADSDAPPRPLARWRKVWSDLKNNTKRKLQKTRAAGQQLRLTHNEFRTLKLIGMIKTKQSAMAAPAPVPVVSVVVPPAAQAQQQGPQDVDYDHIELKDGIIRAVPLEELQQAEAEAEAEAEDEGAWPLEEGEVDGGGGRGLLEEFADCSAPSPPPPPPPAPLACPRPPRPDPRGHTTARGYTSHSCTAEQLARLFDFLEQHRGLATGQLRSATMRQKAKGLWNQIKEQLNAIEGGSIKSVQQWQKVWTDRKYAVRKLAASMQAGTPILPPEELTWETRVMDILGPALPLPLPHPLPLAYNEDHTTMDDDDESSDPLGAAQREEKPGPLRGPGPRPTLPREPLRPSREGRQSTQSRKSSSNGGWRRGGGGRCCRRALGLVSRALARGEARAAAERRDARRQRRREGALHRDWQRIAERALLLLERLVKRGGAGGGGGAGGEGWATVLVPRARPLVLHPDSDWQT